MATEAHSLFEPDSVLPDQFFGAFAQNEALGAERRLMLAVLEDAVECYQKFALAKNPRGRFEFDEARKWIFSDEREWAYSYENICDVLSIDPTYVRRGLARFSANRVRREHRKARIVSVLPHAELQIDGEQGLDVQAPSDADVDRQQALPAA